MFSLREEKTMGATSPIEYHCTRCHSDKRTRNRTGRGHILPNACGQDGCGSPFFDTLPEICFKTIFEPFHSVSQWGRQIFLKADGNYCEKCFFRWAKEMRMDTVKAIELWDSRPKKDSNNLVTSY